MIKSIEFKNFRNLEGKYEFNNLFNVVIGKNNSGKTNLLDGIKLAMSSINGDYFRIRKSDFKDSDDTKEIIIEVNLNDNVISTLNSYDSNKNMVCGFVVWVNRAKNGRYTKRITLLNGMDVDYDSLQEDENLPRIFEIPFIRVNDIHLEGLTTGINNFIKHEDAYKSIIKKSKDAIKEEIKEKQDLFNDICNKFGKKFDIELTDAKIENEKVYIVEHNDIKHLEHNYYIGSGYKSIANIILNIMQTKNSIVLIDEIENHLHPSLLRILVRELKNEDNGFILATTHSPVVINEMKIENVIDITTKKFNELKDEVIKKLDLFMHPGRGELLLSDNIVLVEGYTEELLLTYYLNKNILNLTVVNVAGVMFEPYIDVAVLLNKHIIVMSDNDKGLSSENKKSPRYEKLEKKCKECNIKIIEINNTLETDLFEGGYLSDCVDLLEKKKDYMVSKKHMKTRIAEFLIENKIDLDNWHAIVDIKNEFSNN